MKRYKYSTNKEPLAFEAALSYLKMTKEFTGTAKEFLEGQDIWCPIPINIDMYFTYRPYLEIMGLDGLVDKELKRIGIDKYYPYDKKYGYYAPVVQSGYNVIQIPCPTRSPETEPSDEELVPYDEWDTDKDAIKCLSGYVVEDIEMVPPVAGVIIDKNQNLGVETPLKDLTPQI